MRVDEMGADKMGSRRSGMTLSLPSYGGKQVLKFLILKQGRVYFLGSEKMLVIEKTLWMWGLICVFIFIKQFFS